MSSKNKSVISLYFDVLSPYSWIAFEALTRYREIWNIHLKLKPFHLGMVMKAAGNKPPITASPAKGPYMITDLDRNNQFYNMNIQPPMRFTQWLKTKTTVNAQRLLIAVQHKQPDLLETLAREFWKRVWSEGEPIFDNEDFEIVMKAAGIQNPNEMLAYSQTDAVKAELTANSNEAIDEGAFGAPWIIVEHDGSNHSFFGSDRMHLIANLIGETFTTGQNHLSKL